MKWTAKFLSLVFLGWGPGATTGLLALMGFSLVITEGVWGWGDWSLSLIVAAFLGAVGAAVGFLLGWFVVGHLFNFVWDRWLAGPTIDEQRHQEIIDRLAVIEDLLPAQVVVEAPPAD